MACAEVHQYDVGTVFVVTLVDQDGVAVNLSETDVRTFRFKKPSGEVLLKVAVFADDGDGTDGKLSYTVPDATILDKGGTWSLQAYVHWADGSQWSSEVHEFPVKENLNS